MNEVIPFPSRVGNDPDKVLQAVTGQGMEDVVVVGWRDGKAKVYSSTSDAERVIFMLEMAKHEFLKIIDEQS